MQLIRVQSHYHPNWGTVTQFDALREGRLVRVPQPIALTAEPCPAFDSPDNVRWVPELWKAANVLGRVLDADPAVAMLAVERVRRAMLDGAAP